MYHLWRKIRHWFDAIITHITGCHIALICILYAIFSYLLLYFSHEHSLISPLSHFAYYLIVTASTVGYGDISPETAMGKYVVALFIIPFGLSIFALVIGFTTSSIINFTRLGIIGKREVNVTNHILILGWNGQRTIQLIEMLLFDEKNSRPIVLCVRADIENPLPKSIEFVRTTNFTDTSAMKYAHIEEASCIIIDNQEDDVTFAAALFCTNQNPNAHLLTYFQDEVLRDLVKVYCANVECIPSVAVEMLAKSALDPGSSVLHKELLNTKIGMTQYTVTYPESCPETTVENLFLKLKKQHDVTLIGIRRKKEIKLNPPLDTLILPNDVIFYISSARIERFLW